MNFPGGRQIPNTIKRPLILGQELGFPYGHAVTPGAQSGWCPPNKPFEPTVERSEVFVNSEPGGWRTSTDLEEVFELLTEIVTIGVVCSGERILTLKRR